MTMANTAKTANVNVRLRDDPRKAPARHPKTPNAARAHASDTSANLEPVSSRHAPSRSKAKPANPANKRSLAARKTPSPNGIDITRYPARKFGMVKVEKTRQAVSPLRAFSTY